MKKLVLVVLCGCLGLWCGCSNNSASSATGSGTGSATVKALANNLREVAALDSVWLGSDSGDIDEAPKHSVRLDSFAMETFEVTNGEFAEVMNWIMSTNPDSSQRIVHTDTSFGSDTVISTVYELIRVDSMAISGDTVYHAGLPLILLDLAYFTPDTVYTLDSTMSSNRTERKKYITALTLTPVNSYINYPVVQVSWYGAQFFCDAKSAKDSLSPDSSQYRLPREAEWEAAARAGLPYNSSFYPTGNTISLHTANYRQLNERALAAVNAYPPNPDSIYNLAGNAWEWCADFYAASFYTSLAAGVHNPVNTATGPTMVIRGGSYMDDAREQRSSNRDYLEPSRLEPFMGFRVVRTR
ncbi:MAG: hypothetical protein A2350_18925 [Candidatus Raymondbacteria bacterium RifOxyB12_full_50_8]|uniref:Sulfatase-modifying factor enzyme-like domain-containing protein n=1 Tax=Candidatus Raymondbacteria bacterium RIFOXYD12_FULL_49_13 TaxID=1817890 RepID=A0A1F7FCQ3_UNCRA|nr:MAG: hypothetical protein A2248_03005 [Candidatus Raymondbacteria bacterium RIFOXYA2_FULL_49_16]OGJ93450.1 MAG: hypothetical protein A2350_18925 [Candidatus Raymondbacteria bacterium RifOxyB12_full_50_8]OGK04292.1 MAG: hypothetical protein A2519_18200 [Candidatus Raymondbacteria bacterium RIFOXYD12_FULL_49_13]OGP42424.1 MAG: hypothetical protein A2324_17040 [Candidatus Raymondbacteria bacterium RIFOXYB2_FULL_49_35]